MTSQEFLYYSLAIGFLILVGSISYAAYRLAEALRAFKLIIDNVEDAAKDLNVIKNKIKLGALTTVGAMLGAFLKKGR